MEELTYNEIKNKVNDSWALIYNPVYSEKTGDLVKGELVYWHKNRKKVEKKVLKDKNPNKHFTVQYFGEIPADDHLLNFF